MRRQQRNGRRGAVFSVRVTDEERARLEDFQRAGGGPRSLGPWMLWRALGAGPGTTGPAGVGSTRSSAVSSGSTRPGVAGCSSGSTRTRERVILDLCAGSGSWSRPYADAGYDVRRVTLPEGDVRSYVPPVGVWGVLAAPPCTVFSVARRGEPSAAEFLAAMEVVFACLRIVALTAPQWWAMENPAGRLSRWMGTPRDTWEPCDFGDAWTKRTCLWGRFTVPARGPFVEPRGGMDARDDAPPGSTIAARRAVTPAGFARAFCEANP